MRIIIVEDSVLLREGMVRLIKDAGHTVTAALPDATQLLEVVNENPPELAIIDVRLPPTWTDEGVRAAMELRASQPEVAIMVLSQYVEEQYASELIRSNNGALAYLLKDRVADVSDFLETIDRLGAGATVLDPEVVSQLLVRRAADERMQRLTKRESSVLSLIAEGRSNQAIAASLHISAGSVEKHITSLFTKLELEQDDSGNRRVLAALAHLEHATENQPTERPS